MRIRRNLMACLLGGAWLTVLPALRAMDKGALPEQGEARFDPGPPKKDPREEMEPDPAWRWPPADRSGTGGQRLAAKNLGVLTYEACVRQIETSQEKGQALSFFQAAKGEQVGDVKYFFLGTLFRTDDAQVRHLTRGRHGFLYWHYGQSSDVLFLTPTGIHSTLPGLSDNKAIHYMGANALQELVYFGDAEFGGLENRFAAPGERKTGESFLQWRRKSPAGLRRVYPGTQDGFWIQGAGSFHYAGPGGQLSEDLAKGVDLPWAQATGMASGPNRTVVCTVLERDEIHFLFDRSLVCRKVEGGRPHSVARGPGEQIWITLEGLDKFMMLDCRTRDLSLIGLEPSVEPRGPRALTLGPDGNMWVALAGIGAIGRLAPDGQFTTFGLLPGDVPLELAPTPDGILFTLERSDRSGFIRALVPGAPGRAEAPAARASGSAPRRIREKALTKAERWALHGARVRRAEERERARREEAEPAAPAGPEAGVECKQPAEPFAGLAALGVYLDWPDIRHILKGHAYGSAVPGKGRFAQAHSTGEGMARLLARSLADSGAIGRITDASGGICYTKCAAEGVGWYRSRDGALVPADHFVVVTSRTWNQQLRDYDHDILTAYPVHRNW